MRPAGTSDVGGDPKLAPSKRHAFKHEGRTIYEWDQTLAEVNVYVPTPPGVRGRDLDVSIERQRLRFGLRGNPPFLDGPLFSTVRTDDSLWTLEDGVLHFNLTKSEPGEAWPCVIKGHEGQVDEAAKREDAQRLLLERFQHEHPGFDFSAATVNGDEVPDARTFLGGIGGGSGGPRRGRGLFASAPLARGDAALRLPASGLLAVPLVQQGDDTHSEAVLELYERYLDAWARGNGGRVLPKGLRALLLRPLQEKADDDENPQQQSIIGPAARLAAFLLWAVGGDGDGDQQHRWRQYASTVLPRPPPSLLVGVGGGAPPPPTWLPDPQSMLLDAYPGELEDAVAAGAGDLVEKALKMRAQAAQASAAARRALRGGWWWGGDRAGGDDEEDEEQQWWWWALDMAKSRAFALSCGTGLRLAVLAPVADLLNHGGDDEDEQEGAACACRLDNNTDPSSPSPFSLVVAARRAVKSGEELTLDYTSSSAPGSSAELDSAALAAGYRFVPAGGCVGDRLSRGRVPTPLPRSPLTPARRRALARAADALAEDASFPRARRRAHRALASLLEAWGGGAGGGGDDRGEATTPPPEKLSPAVAAFLRERQLLEEAARGVLRRVEEQEG